MNITTYENSLTQLTLICIRKHLVFRLLPMFTGCDLKKNIFPFPFRDMSFAFKPKRGGSHRGGGNFRGHGGPRGKDFGSFSIVSVTIRSAVVLLQPNLYNLVFTQNWRSKQKTISGLRLSVRVNVQGVKSLGGHFAWLCRGFEFYEVKKKKICYYFSKRKWKYFYTFHYFYCEKSSKRGK